MSIERDRLTAFFNRLLEPERYQDYGPNGLQIEGTETISKIAFAVSATVRSAQKAIETGADALVVHHGLFWRFHGPRPLVGPFAQRVHPLVRHRINLYGYHLPLDGHPEVGNAAALARRIGLTDLSPFGEYQGATVGMQGTLSNPCAPKTLQQRLEQVLEHPVMLACPEPEARLSRIGIITGGANGEWKQALAAGMDAYITGEMSEHDWHESQEAGIHMFAGGHHATEQFGVQELMVKVSEAFPVECVYLPSDNPA
ncbi:Nif3-like dinuclear metal center hexameric protein [Methylohalobius crimeensis]|uniref:Nif3-like dinuclear metal center hexameric protein n=1 Tax=Methylohalobius crimeensis TaxID=244365 RepID=UPI0003B6BB08|nr:Nif3-like dinuclear metal center hexameric protein [Methylohalobius crimeensis]